MFNFLEKNYRKLPNSYIKSLIKNVFIFIIFSFVQKTKKISIQKIKFSIYEDRLSPVIDLLNDMKGYIKYYTLKKGDIVIDAGAYNGLFTIYASKVVGPTGRVIAFEPDPYNFRILTRNIELNKLKNVTVIKKGLYDKEDRVSFDVQAYGSNIIDDNKHIVTLNSIITTTLDIELKKLGVTKVNFIKMDIEGAELKAVYGCMQTIKNNINIHFAIASYHIVKGKPTYQMLTLFFKKIGLETTVGYKDHTTTYAARRLLQLKREINIP